MQLSKSGSSSFNHDVNGSGSASRRVVSPEVNGGGSVNVLIASGNQTLTSSVYAMTVSDFSAYGNIAAIKL